MTEQQFRSAFDLFAFAGIAGFYWAWLTHETWWGRLLALVAVVVLVSTMAPDLKW
jgi:hypothetical protein